MSDIVYISGYIATGCGPNSENKVKRRELYNLLSRLNYEFPIGPDLFYLVNYQHNVWNRDLIGITGVVKNLKPSLAEEKFGKLFIGLKDYWNFITIFLESGDWPFRGEPRIVELSWRNIAGKISYIRNEFDKP